MQLKIRHPKISFMRSQQMSCSDLTNLIEAHWHCMLSYHLVNVGSGNGLLPDGTMPLPATMLTIGNHQWCSVAFTSGQTLQISIFDMSLKITNLRLQSHLQWGTSKLKTGHHIIVPDLATRLLNKWTCPSTHGGEDCCHVLHGQLYLVCTSTVTEKGTK